MPSLPIPIISLSPSAFSLTSHNTGFSFNSSQMSEQQTYFSLSLSLSLSLFLFETNPELSSKNVDGHLPKRSKARVIEWLWNKFDTCQLNGFFKLAQPRPLSFLMGHPGPLLSLFYVFSNKHYNFYINICEKVHPVSGAGIRTHDLLDVSLLPLPLDQVSLP